MTIILNGSSSSGKTTLLNLIATKSNEFFVRFGIDLFVGHLFPPQYIMFNEKADQGFQLIKHGNSIDTKLGIYGRRLTETFLEMMKLLSDRGFHIVSDDVILYPYDLMKYSIMNPDTTFFIGVLCDKEESIRREKARGNRPQGLVEGQWDLVHTNKEFYDFTVDNTGDFEKNADLILEFVLNNQANGLRRYFENLSRKRGTFAAF
jgi:chloramphenicol 3-O phosphotransferase